MCISIPAKIVDTEEPQSARPALAQSVTVEVDGGLRRKIFLAPGVDATGWVLINAGVAVANITDDEASEMRQLLNRAKA